MLLLDGVHARGAGGRAALKGVSLRVHPGEIVGVAGVDGNGQRELAEMICGLRRAEAGRLFLSGVPLPRLDPAQARRLGVAHVPEDRLLRAVIGPMSVEENVALGRQGEPPFARGGLIDFPGRQERARKLIQRFDVRPPVPAARLAELSGGNQQKVVVARELDCQPKLLVAAQPTRGLDVAAVSLVHRELRRERERGCAVLLISLDLDELLTLSDRLYTLYEGQVTGEFERERFDEREIGRRMLGGGETNA